MTRIPGINRRTFLRSSATAAAALPLTTVELSLAQSASSFSFAYLSDAHIQQAQGGAFVRNWDRGLIRAVAEINLLNPRPDFVVFGGDLAHAGTHAELDHGAEILSRLKGLTTHMVMGEHDYYLDLGAYWSKLFGAQHYSFDHKGVHFVVLNSVLTDEKWIHQRWSSPAARMNEIALRDNPHSPPFMVGAAQREWLKKDLAKLEKSTPIVVCSHTPLQKLFRGWNFWTDDADEIYPLLAPFDRVSVIYGHVHQIQYNQIGNVSFHSAMSTAWPWPYPESYSQAQRHSMPKLTVPMNRADPFFERDGTGWQLVDFGAGRAAVSYHPGDNPSRRIIYNSATKRLEDEQFPDPARRTPAQTHY